MMDSIPNEARRPKHIPSPDGDWGNISSFALTFHGYEAWGSFETCAQIANEAKPSTLTELRTCLFFEQRRWRHFGEAPDDEVMGYIRDLVRRIHEQVAISDLE